MSLYDPFSFGCIVEQEACFRPAQKEKRRLYKNFSAPSPCGSILLPISLGIKGELPAFGEVNESFPSS
ncbi:MAG: hypothetical protein JXR86_05045, partial [Spirochaetales bacterium]|nr:hypothetical protein [Spirochaetales bacterium]